MAPEADPKSWRDVYTLVRDAREDVLSEVRTVKAQMDTHLLEHASAKGRKEGITIAIGGARAALLVVIAALGPVIGMIAILTR